MDALVPTFRRAFSSGAWRRMRAGRGVSAEEYVLFLQLVNRNPCVLVLNRDQPKPRLGRVRHKILMSEAHIGACLISYLALVSRAGPTPAGAAPVMLYDGRVGHVITVRSINDAKDWIAYDDPTWPGGLSMLCGGQNGADVQAQHFGNPDVGQWIVHVTQLFRVVFGVPLSLSEAPVWRRWAREFDGYLRDRYRVTF